MQKPLALVLCLMLTSVIQAQTLVFKMILFGDSVGLSTVSRSHGPDGTDKYSLDSRIRGKVLWITRENHTHIESEYKDGRLISASYYEINNGKKDKWSNIRYDGHQYQAETYEGHKTFAEAPAFSVGPLYCDGYDPARKRMFYEPEAEYIELQFTQPNTIEFKSPDGNKNIFHFRNGQVSNVEFHTTLANVYLKRVN